MRPRSSRVETVPVAPMKKITIFGPVMPTKGERLKAVQSNLSSGSKPVLPWNSGPGLKNMRNAVSGDPEKPKKERPHSKTKASGYQKKTRLNCNHLDSSFVRKEPYYLREITENADFRSSHVIPSVIREPRGAVDGRKIYEITEDDKRDVKRDHEWRPTEKVQRRVRSFEDLCGTTFDDPSENIENSEKFKKTVTFATDTEKFDEKIPSNKEHFNSNTSDERDCDNWAKTSFPKDITLPPYLSSNVYSSPESFTSRLGSDSMRSDKDAGLDYCPFCEQDGNNTHYDNFFSYLYDCPLCDERSRAMDFRYDKDRESLFQRDDFYTKDSSARSSHNYKKKNRERGRKFATGNKNSWSDNDLDCVQHFREKNGHNGSLHSCSSSKPYCVHHYTQNDRLFLEPSNTREGKSVCSECGTPQYLNENNKDPYMYHITLQDLKKKKDFQRSENSDERRNFSEVHLPNRQKIDDTSKHIFAKVKGHVGHILEKDFHYSCRSDEADELRNRTLAFHKRCPSSSMAFVDHIQ
ncbi:uncharacterized protein LOC143029583 [Oratosquilla oratoria]|uniref:uncharacterized protein LOC143029583 n=1 Tax=Oratosquilla oratoria TaxID=337810 RepID=UPI003F7733F4